MKKVTFLYISLLCILTLKVQTASAKSFPDNQTFFYTNTQRSGLVQAQFYYDNQNEPVCSMFVGHSTHQYYWWGSNSSNALEFYGFQYSPEVQSKASPYGPIPMVTYTGRIIKSRNSNRFSLSSDYSQLIINNNVYNVRISEQEYKKLWNQMFGNSGGGSNIVVPNGGTNNRTNGEVSTPRHQDTRCKYCRGTGNCSSCNGKGYKFNPYSGHNDTCPSCNGKGRCFNCYGSGRQR
jgi:hypothetical protein